MHSTLLRKLLIGILILLMACNPTQSPARPSQPVPGTPQSLEFGYGARIEATDPHFESLLRLAAQQNLSWVALHFDWAAAQPSPNTWHAGSAFSEALRLAHSLQLATLVSITNPPDWAVNDNGPRVEPTTQLVLKLTREEWAPLALELLPGANTRAGWKAAPNARAYARLFNTVQAHLNAEHLKVYLVAGGLSNRLSSSEDVQDVDFLRALYAAELRPNILSIRLQSLIGEPLAHPRADTLRHYEEIRAVMTAHQHDDGLLWITDLNLSAGVQEQTWLQQAYPIMRSQLYLGVVFCSPIYLNAQRLPLSEVNP